MLLLLLKHWKAIAAGAVFILYTSAVFFSGSHVGALKEHKLLSGELLAQKELVQELRLSIKDQNHGLDLLEASVKANEEQRQALEKALTKERQRSARLAQVASSVKASSVFEMTKKLQGLK